MRRNTFLWILWIALTLGLAGTALARLYVGGDRTTLLPDNTAGVHHQIEIACETCHTSKPFAGQTKIRKDINKTCVTCHKEELKASDDSHPKKKFTNPRMAAYWDKVDARWCTTCHAEHQPDTTLPGMVTLQGDFCVACHSEGEQDVRVNRPTHADLTFDTCASAGCHNFHDNRALYEDFLVKHADADWLSAEPVHGPEAIARARPRPAAEEIETYLASLTAPETARDGGIEDLWAHSAHATAEVGCGGCHAPDMETEEEILANWIDAPGEEVCADCHRKQAKSFAQGRHGMRRHPEIARPRKAKTALKRLGIKDPSDDLIAATESWLTDAPPPPLMSTSEARVELRPEAHGQDLTCNTCHTPHEQDVTHAAVEACLTCHNDDHSLAYEDSPHAAAWAAEQLGVEPAGSGVTCATCHMPKSERKGIATSTHNQNEFLRPNEKMIRPVCMECHGLGFAIDALADPALVANNFKGKPSRHIESIDWATSRVDQSAESANQ